MTHGRRRRPPPRADADGGLVPRTIDCIDCGGTCHVLGHAPEGGFGPGDVVAYRCEDCLDRWDVVVPELDDEHLGPAAT